MDLKSILNERNQSGKPTSSELKENVVKFALVTGKKFGGSIVV